jgi:hypothetical protein
MGKERLVPHPDWLADDDTQRFRKKLGEQREARLKELLVKAEKSTDAQVASACARVLELERVIEQLNRKGEDE